uniref:Rhodopsin n=1 Tax=Oryzias sinensis TaxID=183150 RepID=A0A8C7WRS3_9TELE
IGYPPQDYPPQGYPPQGYPAGQMGPGAPYSGPGQPPMQGYPGQPQFGWQGGPPPGPVYGEAPKNTGETEKHFSLNGGTSVFKKILMHSWFICSSCDLQRLVLNSELLKA